MTRRETEWDEDERLWALALLDYDADACPGCGGQMTETTSPDAEYGYRVPPPTRCHRCTALAIAHDRHRDAAHPQALLWIAERQ